MSAPALQLVPGTVQALRAWDLIPEAGTGRVHLGAIAHRLIWPRKGISAECVGGGHVGDDEGAPGPACDCGIYGWHPHEADPELFAEYADMGQIAGVIDAWGRIEVHESGIRAEHARVSRLLVAEHAVAEDLRSAQEAATTYGVPLVRLRPEKLASWVAAEVRGLDTAFVERLLSAERRLVFEPSSISYISRRGEAIGGFGFVEASTGRHPKRFQAVMPAGPLATEVVRVAGAKYHDEALQAPEFDPGRALALVPEPDNPRNSDAISVWDAARSRKVGYVPRGLAEDVGARLAADRIRSVRSAWQWRDLRTGRRTGLHMLLAPTPTVEFLGGEQLSLDAAA